MSFLFAFFAIICGIVLVLKIDAGTLEPLQVAGIGIILAVLACLAPADFSWTKRG